jgi:hypothetical protein
MIRCLANFLESEDAEVSFRISNDRVFTTIRTKTIMVENEDSKAEFEEQPLPYIVSAVMELVSEYNDMTGIKNAGK